MTNKALKSKKEEGERIQKKLNFDTSTTRQWLQITSPLTSACNTTHMISRWGFVVCFCCFCLPIFYIFQSVWIVVQDYRSNPSKFSVLNLPFDETKQRFYLPPDFNVTEWIKDGKFIGNPNQKPKPTTIRTNQQTNKKKHKGWKEAKDQYPIYLLIISQHIFSVVVFFSQCRLQASLVTSSKQNSNQIGRRAFLINHICSIISNRTLFFSFLLIKRNVVEDLASTRRFVPVSKESWLMEEVMSLAYCIWIEGDWCIMKDSGNSSQRRNRRRVVVSHEQTESTSVCSLSMSKRMGEERGSDSSFTFDV